MTVPLTRIVELSRDFYRRAVAMETTGRNMPKAQRKGVVAEAARFREVSEALSELANIREALE